MVECTVGCVVRLRGVRLTRRRRENMILTRRPPARREAFMRCKVLREGLSMTEGIPTRRDLESRFRLVSTPITFGEGAAEEEGWEFKQLGVKRAMIDTD